MLFNSYIPISKGIEVVVKKLNNMVLLDTSIGMNIRLDKFVSLIKDMGQKASVNKLVSLIENMGQKASEMPKVSLDYLKSSFQMNSHCKVPEANNRKVESDDSNSKRSWRCLAVQKFKHLVKQGPNVLIIIRLT